MFLVDLARSKTPNYTPLTVSAPEYLYVLAEAIARSVPDVEVRAKLGPGAGDAVVFHGDDTSARDDQLF